MTSREAQCLRLSFDSSCIDNFRQVTIAEKENELRAQYIVLVSALAEWRGLKRFFPYATIEATPFGEYFVDLVNFPEGKREIVFMFGGWGKISAAASAQYAIDRWRPDLVINLGTCGGFRGRIERGEIILVDRTVVYDIYERMGDPDEHIAFYTTDLDTGWAHTLPENARREKLVSGDRDLDPAEVATLAEKYQAVAGDWESGAIAWVARRNQTPILILRGVTDLVDAEGGEAYGDLGVFEQAAGKVLGRLLSELPRYLSMWEDARSGKSS